MSIGSQEVFVDEQRTVMATFPVQTLQKEPSWPLAIRNLAGEHLGVAARILLNTLAAGIAEVLMRCYWKLTNLYVLYRVVFRKLNLL